MKNISQLIIIENHEVISHYILEKADSYDVAKMVKRNWEYLSLLSKRKVIEINSNHYFYFFGEKQTTLEIHHL